MKKEEGTDTTISLCVSIFAIVAPRLAFMLERTPATVASWTIQEGGGSSCL
jgi:hypothetical protein